MPGQNIKYYIDVQDALYYTLRRDEDAAVALEKELTGINSTLREIAGAAGIGFGISELVNFSKEILQVAADYEVNMLRIRNASSNAAEGIKNQQFILSEVDKYKIPIQEATEAYGNLLVKIGNSGLASEEVRKLHDNILAIAKVTGSTSNQMNNAVYDIGKMLGEGVLEARSTRALERVFPQITKFLSDRLGVTRQELNRLESSGRLTKAGVDSNVLLQAVNDYANSIRDKIPEATATMQSSMTDIANSWTRFQIEIVDKLKPEISRLFVELKDGVEWLRAHEDGLIRWAGIIKNLAELYVGYKVAVGLVNIAEKSYMAFMEGYAGAAATKVTAINAETVAYTELTAAIERLNFVSNAESASFIAGPNGIMANTKGNRYIATAEQSAAESEAVVGGITGAGLVSALNAATISVSIVAIAATVIDILTRHFFPSKGIYSDVDNEDIPALHKGNQTTYLPLASREHITKALGLDGLPAYNPDWVPPWMQPGKNTPGKKAGANEHILPPDDKIVGQHVINYNITIHEMNGQKIGTQTVEGDAKSIQHSAEDVARLLQSVMNDTQIRR